MTTTKAGPFDLDYWDVGSGPAVVLLHSSASGNRQWRKLADALKDRHRLIAVNLFGYGATSPWPGQRPVRLADHAELVSAAVSLAAEPVAIVGHSLGGAVALESAMRLGSRVRTVIAFEPILFHLLKMHGPAEAFAEIDATRGGHYQRAARGDWTGAGELFIDYWSGAGTWASLSDERRTGLLTTLPNVIDEWGSSFGAEHGPASCLKMLPGIADEWGKLEKTGRSLADWGGIAAPVHLIRAADTVPPTRVITSLLAGAHPSWRLHEVPSGGHMAPVTRPDLVNPLIAQLVAGSAGSAGS
jgi:pimeloyl-ACP methyl ester carboxylesterase